MSKCRGGVNEKEIADLTLDDLENVNENDE